MECFERFKNILFIYSTISRGNSDDVLRNSGRETERLVTAGSGSDGCDLLVTADRVWCQVLNGLERRRVVFVTKSPNEKLVMIFTSILDTNRNSSRLNREDVIGLET